MDGQFDPYDEWLGIPPEQQPPDHYQLLGLPGFEDDKTRIRTAAEKQIANVRQFQLGPHSEASQCLLNEIAAARNCLLNGKSKRQYDIEHGHSGSLKRALAIDEAVKSDPLAPVRREAVAKPPRLSRAIERTGADRESESASWLAQVPVWVWVAIAGGLAPLVLVLMLVLHRSVTQRATVRKTDELKIGEVLSKDQQPTNADPVKMPYASGSTSSKKTVVKDTPVLNVPRVAGPPTIEPIGNQKMVPGDTLSLQVIARDAGGDDFGLSYELVSGPPNAAFNPVNGRLRWKSGMEDEGQNYSVVVRVKDVANSHTAQESFTIRVGRRGRLRTDPTVQLSFDQSTVYTQGQQQFFRDSSGNEHHAANHGASLVDGLFGDAVAYRANTSYLAIASHPSLQGGGEARLSVSVWCRCNNPKSSGFEIAKTWTQKAKDWSLFTNQTLNFQSALSSSYGRSGGTITSGWHHVAFVFNQPQRRLQLYLDGAVVAEDNQLGNISAATEGIIYLRARVTEHRRPGDTIMVVVDDLLIYNRALSPEEILTIYLRGKIRPDSRVSTTVDSQQPIDKLTVHKPKTKSAIPRKSEIEVARNTLQEQIADKSSAELLLMAAARPTAVARKYVLLVTSLSDAAEAGDFKTASGAIAMIDRAFQVDLLALENKTIATVLAADSPSTDWGEVCRTALRVSKQASLLGNNELAKQVATYALIAARKSGDTGLSNQAMLHFINLD